MSTYEHLGATITAQIPDREEATPGYTLEQAAAYGVYAGMANITKWLIVGGVLVMASALVPWKQLYREITQ